MSWWRSRCASSTGASYHTGASLQRSRSVPRPVVLHVLALFSWRCLYRAGEIVALGRCRGVSVLSRLQYPKYRFTRSTFCPGHEVLALVRPTVPYKLALSLKRSQPVVSPASLPIGGQTQAPRAGWPFVSPLLFSSNWK